MGKNNKQQPPRQRPRDRMWDHLREIYRNVACYTLIPAGVAPLARDRAILVKVQEQGNLTALEQHMGLLSRDLGDFTSQLETIHAKHSNRGGATYDQNERMQAIQIFEEYVEWANSYERVILPTMTEITNIFIAAGGTLPSNLPTEGSVVAAAKPSADM